MISDIANDGISAKIMSNTKGLVIYNFITSCRYNVKGKKVYGIYPPDKLFLPSDVFDDNNSEQRSLIEDIDKFSIKKMHSELLRVSKLRDDIEEALNKISKNVQNDKSFIEELNNKLQLLLEKKIELSLGSKITGIDDYFDYESYKNDLQNKIDELEKENNRLKDELLKEKQDRRNEIEMLKQKIEDEHEYFENKSKGIFRRLF